MSQSDPAVILASESPRRSELLAALGLSFAVRPADVDETPLPGEAPDALALRLSLAKAAFAARHSPRAIIIAADTLVVLGDAALGKPTTRDHALEMLDRLRGRTHHVLTGFTLQNGVTGQACTQLARTPVTMRAYTEAEMRAYVASGDPMDKAGAYAVQNHAFAPVERLDGCYANVVGLPLCHLHRVLTRWGVPLRHPLERCPWPLEHGGCQWADRILADQAD